MEIVRGVMGKLSVSAVSIVFIFTATATGAEPVEEQLRRCDLALTAKKEEAHLCDLGVQLRSDEMARLETRNAALEDRGTALFSNPFVWAAIGVIAGTYFGARATR